MTMSRNVRLTIFCALVVLYIATRLWHLADSCLWFDEIYGVHAAEHGWRELFAFVAVDLIHPPLFYVLLKLWIAVGGEGLLWLRLLPVLLAVAAIAPFHFLAGELGMKRYGSSELLALLFMAVNGSWLKYSQEVRMYSLLMLVGVTSTWLFVRYLNSGRGFWWLVATNSMLVWTHYFGWFVVAAELAVVILLRREKNIRMLVMLAILAACFAPWGAAIARSASAANLHQNIGWMPRPGLSDLGVLLLNLVEPFYQRLSSVDPASAYLVSVPLIVILSISAMLLLVRGKVRVESTPFLPILGVLIVVPVLAALVISWLAPMSIWGTRHLIIIFPAASLLVAYILANVPTRSWRTGSVVTVVLLMVLAGIMQASRAAPRYSWCTWNDIALEARKDGAGKLYVFEDLAAYHAWFALRSFEEPRVIKIGGLDIGEDAAYFLPRGFDGVGHADLAGIDDAEVWIAFRSRQFDEREPPLRNFLMKGFHVVEQKKVPAEGEDVYLVKLGR